MATRKNSTKQAPKKQVRVVLPQGMTKDDVQDFKAIKAERDQFQKQLVDLQRSVINKRPDAIETNGAIKMSEEDVAYHKELRDNPNRTGPSAVRNGVPKVAAPKPQTKLEIFADQLKSINQRLIQQIGSLLHATQRLTGSRPEVDEKELESLLEQCKKEDEVGFPISKLAAQLRLAEIHAGAIGIATENLATLA